ncbi:DUF4376 domain-containing protein [Pasteurellaceae bacterium HPA106]|uniref:DUF4376 domain-containing protein n=1 Tax=Spirabiliibacterium pneumoniae TaxID=221400 RepID=UPI001AACCF41|nr:DUF4376 domain-containing protein [Spirabiliibacterium pneumoniae]MBE2895562.1 DUF4376 domain-containing protein [Spirabiliibacterium pneumoniae]
MIQFDEQGFALESGHVTAYRVDELGLYSHSEQEFVSVGTGLSAGAYLDAPPEPKPHFAIRRTEDDTAWEYIADHRGETVYYTETGEAIQITAVGDYPENTTTIARPSDCYEWQGDGWVLNPEKQAQQKAVVQSTVWEEIKQERYDHTHSGVYVKSIKKWFHSDEPSRIQYLTMQQLAELPPALQWKTMDNSFVEMTKPLLNELILTLIAEEQADFANAEKHRLAMLAVDNPSDYDYSTGWSKNYGE